jgi:capsular polysaccharide biosynthesis protein/thioredoxin-like negative regulator of GroEL
MSEMSSYTPAVLARLAALGNVQSLRELGEELLAGPLDDERQQAGLLRIIKQLQRLRAIPELESLLERLLGCPDDHPSWAEAVLTTVAALRASAQRLSDQERLGRLLGRVVQRLEPRGVALCDARLVTALNQCAEFDRLHELLPHLATNLGDAAARSVLLSTLERLFHYEMLGDAGQYIELVYQNDPDDPMAVLLFARYLAAQGVPNSQIEPVFEAVRSDPPHYDDAVLWRAQLHYDAGEHVQVIQWLAAHPLHEPDKARSLIERVQAVVDRPSLPYSAETADGERLNLHRLGPLAPLLMPLVQALNGDLSDSAQPPPEELRSHLHSVVLAVAKATKFAGDLAPVDCLNAARELVRAATMHLRDPIEVHRVELAPLRYGTLAVTRMTDMFVTLHRVSIQLSRYGIEAALRDAPLSDVRHLCQLAEVHVQSALSLGETRTSESLLKAMHSRQVAPAFVQRLLERCALQRGDISAAAALVDGQPGMSGEIFSLEPFDSWIRVEAVRSETLIYQEPWKGIFDYLDLQGNLHQVPHEVPETRVDLLHVPGLRVRDTELLIGPKGSIPRPHPWHFRHMYGGYPRESSIRLNYGHRGCRLRPASERLHLREPVVALVNMDGPYWRNYGHWMLLILTRVAVLLDRGVFEHRRLLVPVELSRWMTASLELVGLPEERMLRYRAEQEVLADDSMVVGPVEFAAASLVRSLQRRLWAAAGVDPKSLKPQGPVWLSRRRTNPRCLANSHAIEALARQLGFDVIAPESLSLIEQIRLSAHATGVAGQFGSNLTNLIFARPGTPVLGLVDETSRDSFFVNICASMDLPQRWLTGAHKSWWGSLDEAFEVDMAVLDRELHRLITEAS